MTATKIYCLGDSHSMILCEGDSVSGNCEFIDLHKIATSISGLNNPRSTLQYGEFIKSKVPLFTKSDYAVFKLGAVDMEYIYYYKTCVSNLHITVEEFTDRLVQSYERFLDEAGIRERTNVIISALHLPSYYSDAYIQSHIPRICVGIENCDSTKLTEVEQRFRNMNVTRKTLTLNNLLLNDKLKKMCDRLNVTCFDTTGLFIDTVTGLLHEEYVGTPPPGNRYHNGDHHYKSICDKTDMRPRLMTRQALVELINRNISRTAMYQTCLPPCGYDRHEMTCVGSLSSAACGA